MKSNKQDIKAVLKPPAHNAIVCSTDLGTIHQANALETAFENLSKRDYRVYIIAKLMYRNALRVSEIINIKASQMLSDGSIKVETLKGGNNRIIFDSEFSEYFKTMRTSKTKIFEGLNRFYIYREFKKCGISEPKGNKKYDKITHALRHKRALFLQSEGIETKDIKTALAQKSEKSTLHYIKKNEK